MEETHVGGDDRDSERQLLDKETDVVACKSSVSLSGKGLETIDLENLIDSRKYRQPFLLKQQHLPLPIVTTIVRLNLSRNKLTSLPKELFEENYTDGSSSSSSPTPSCPMLEVLDVGRNKLRGLPPEIGNCKRLKVLVALSNNIRMSEFPVDQIVTLPTLEHLDLRWNKKMNTRSSRKRLTELFLGREQNDDSKNIHTQKDFELLLSHSTLLDNNINSDTHLPAKKKLSACDRDANDLRSQLEPYSTPQLRKRLDRTFGISFDDEDKRAYDREHIMQHLLSCYNSNTDGACDTHGRPISNLRERRYERGMKVDPTLMRELQAEMEAIRWPRTTRERPKIAAEGYVILQRPPASLSTTIKPTPMKTDDKTSTPPTNNSCNDSSSSSSSKAAKREAAKLKRFSGIWNKAVEAIESVDEEFASRFTALALTKNFTGSPHIDTLNIAPFYGLSMGDFSNDGGKLCVECSATCVAEIDTRGRFAKVDGRFPHWVSDYEGTRYSLIYYISHGEVVPQTTAIFKPSPCSTGNHGEEEEKEWISPPVFRL